MLLKPAIKDTELLHKIFTTDYESFNETAISVFWFQYQHNKVYRQYCNSLNIKVEKINQVTEIPFLPISFFKTHTIVNGQFNPAAIFESSGTTQSINSKHFVKDLSVYEKSFLTNFILEYGPVNDYCIIGLLPSYLERKNSSLVMMVNKLIDDSNHPQSGFYLNEFEKLQQVLTELERQQQNTLVIGVTFALLDFAEQYPVKLKHSIVMETGGMKGRRAEMTRQQVHEILSNAFQQKNIHSEYGMTELLSQAYSKGNGIFNTPQWMKILIRAEDDPFQIIDKHESNIISGVINIIDLANLYSCSFIATDDAGKLYPDGSFEVMGRLDNSDIRGCSLLAL